MEYIPYGEVFVEERNSQFSTNFLFNAKELDNETGLYYYGARYLDPTGAMWLSVDPMWEKYAGMTPYNYCMGNPVKLVDPDGEGAVRYEEGEQKYLEANVVITLEKVPADASKRDAERINKYNESFKNEVINTLETEYNGSDGSGSMNSKGEKVKFIFNFCYVELEGDIKLDYEDTNNYKEAIKKYSVLGYGKLTNKKGERVPERVSPAIFTRWKMPPVDQSDERGKTRNGIYIFRCRTSKANAHEFIHTLGVPDNGYDKGGLLNSPIQSILPSEVDDIWENALDKYK